jgi:hypothetical protein
MVLIPNNSNPKGIEVVISMLIKIISYFSFYLFDPLVVKLYLTKTIN